ncbi:hypothetical protein [Muriicola sp. Z0-33]|uniref:hypothetical protein n=1 Tax=Muriicola sp. Z0-33 TaxID=2816957 RepID=UPI00223862FE|nr:hypothetical protein [Muriicola sp. Z0-33]MCW5515718.1 hypothetical protein [Muriicola sp. Z0-33]
MKYLKVLIFTIFCSVNVQAQDLTTEQKEQLEYKVSVFMSNDKELQKLWYEDRMDKMKLKGKLRKDYLKIVQYHALKMEQLRKIKNKISADQMKSKLQQQIMLMEVDVKEVLDRNQFEIHQKTWKAIIKAVILKEGLDVK